MKYLIGIDLGTSAVKAARLDTDGNILDAGAAEYPLYQPQNGYAEQNPDDWWNAVKPLLDGIIDKAGAQNIAGIGLSGQMHGLVTLDESGKVIRPAILWCDQRTGAQCEQITPCRALQRPKFCGCGSTNRRIMRNAGIFFCQRTISGISLPACLPLMCPTPAVCSCWTSKNAVGRRRSWKN